MRYIIHNSLSWAGYTHRILPKLEANRFLQSIKKVSRLPSLSKKVWKIASQARGPLPVDHMITIGRSP